MATPTVWVLLGKGAGGNGQIKSLADSHYANSDCVMYSNMHDMLARPDIDAVLIATGDRWHTMASITAAKAGKDVYCEKPCSMTISESRALSDTFRKYDRIYQAGTQRRSIGNFLFAADLVAKGKLGKLHTVHANTLAPGTSHEWLPEQPLPSKDDLLPLLRGPDCSCFLTIHSILILTNY